MISASSGNAEEDDRGVEEDPDAEDSDCDADCSEAPPLRSAFASAGASASVTRADAPLAPNAAPNAAMSDVRAAATSDDASPPLRPGSGRSLARFQAADIAFGRRSSGSRANGAASRNAESALHAAGTHDRLGSAAAARVRAACSVAATSPSVDDSDAKFRRITNPVLGCTRTSAAARYCRVALPSSICAVAAAAAARTRGDGSATTNRNSVAVGDRGRSCPADVGRSFDQCACRLRGFARASDATHSAALARTRDDPNRSPSRDSPRRLSASLASESDEPAADADADADASARRA